jgi:uncharacterized membrane protein SpoIIM required for sporulation
MRERLFVARRQRGWERLEELLLRADRRGLRSFAPDELEELALQYRSATTDLAASQTRSYSPQTRAYLNRLTERCTALFVVAWIVAYWLVIQRPLNAYALLPSEMIPTIDKSLHDSNFAFDRAYSPAMASAIITNNVKVAMIAFAGGMTLGILTLWEVLQNGLMVGGLGALFASKGFGLDFWATVAPHGVIELTSIQIAAGAGLLLAQAIVAPGRARRIDALKANARRAGVLMIGVAGLLCIAGTIEGFISPQRTPIAFRCAFGALTAVLLFAYLAVAGRKGTNVTADRAT